VLHTRQERPPQLFSDVLYLVSMCQATEVPSSGPDCCARLQKCPVADRTVVLVFTSPFKSLDFFLYWNLDYFSP
jgi:hypothetical protein